MKKRMPLKILIFLLIVFVSQFIYYTFGKIAISSLENDIAYHSDGSSYVIKNQKDSSIIYGISKDGNIENVYFSNDIGIKSGLSSRLSTITSNNGNLYLVKEYINGGTKAIVKQEILEFKGNARITSRPKVLHTFNAVQLPKITSINFTQNIMHISAVSATRKIAYDYEFGLADNKIAKTSQYAAAYNDGFFKAVSDSSGTYILTKSGGVVLCNSQAENVIFGDSGESPLISLIKHDDGIFFSQSNPTKSYTYTKEQGTPLEFILPDMGSEDFIIAGGDIKNRSEYTLKAVDTKSSNAVLVTSSNAVAKILDSINYSITANMICSALGTLFIGLAALAILLIIYVAKKTFAKNKSLLTKVIAASMASIAVVFIALGFMQNYYISTSVKSISFTLANEMAMQAKRNINPEQIAAINNPNTYKSEDYQNTLNDIYVEQSTSENQNKAIENEILIVKNNEIYVGISSKNPCYYPIKMLYKNNSIDEIEKAIKEKTDANMIIEDSVGKWYTNISPVIDSTGNAVGVILTKVSIGAADEVIQNNKIFFTVAILISMILIAIIMFCVFKKALSPLAEITASIKRISTGDYNVTMVENSNDEFYEIKRAFNKTCADLSENLYKLNSIGKSYYRFVPRNINAILGKDSILDVNFGDVKSINASISISSLNNRDKIRNELDDHIFMDFVNDYFYIINESIENNNGIMISNDFNTSAIKSIYTNGSKEAMNASINFIERVENLTISGHSIKTDAMAIIHSTDITYGIAGSDERAFPFLLSSEIDFLGTLTQKFKRTGTKLVVTENVIKDMQSDYLSRCIGFVHSTDLKHTYNLYEIFDVYDADYQKLCEENIANFKQALNLFYHNNFYLARNIFSQILRVCPDDGISRWYLFTCDKYFNSDENVQVSYELFGTDNDIYG